MLKVVSKVNVVSSKFMAGLSTSKDFAFFKVVWGGSLVTVRVNTKDNSLSIRDSTGAVIERPCASKMAVSVEGSTRVGKIRDARDRVSDALSMLDDCEARESRMTERQADIVCSLSEHVASNGELSVKQFELLDSIWEEVTAGG